MKSCRYCCSPTPIQLPIAALTACALPVYCSRLHVLHNEKSVITARCPCRSTVLPTIERNWLREKSINSIRRRKIFNLIQFIFKYRSWKWGDIRRYFHPQKLTKSLSLDFLLLFEKLKGSDLVQVLRMGLTWKFLLRLPHLFKLLRLTETKCHISWKPWFSTILLFKKEKKMLCFSL